MSARSRIAASKPRPASPRASCADHRRSAPPVAAAPQEGITDNVSPRPGVPGSNRIEALAPHSL